MKQLAQYLAAHGRNGDTELMHVTKGEIAALQGIGSLAGKRVTTNPHTGLPEAFEFKSLLPAIAGIGATILSGGTLSPLMAGLISGATSTAMTGDIKQGLISGLAGGAMSGLTQGVMGMGGAAAGSGTGEAINSAAHFSDAAFDAGMQNAASGMGNSVTPHFSDAAFSAAQNGASAAAPRFSDAAFSAGAPGAVGGMPDAGAAAQAFSNPMQAATPSMAGATTPGATGFSGSTFMENIQDPAKWKEHFGGDKLMSRTIPGGIALASTIGDAMMPTYEGGGEPEKDEFAQKEKKSTRSFNAASDPYYAMRGGEHRYFSAPSYNFAEGGGVMSLPNGREADSGTAKVIRSIRSRYRSRQAAVEDMRVPNSFMQRLGIQDPNDPVLDYAFGYTKKQGQRKMKSGNLQMPMGFADGGSIEPVGVRSVDPAERRLRYMDYPTHLSNTIGRSDGMPVKDEKGVRNEPVKVPKTKINRKMMAAGGAIEGAGDGMSDSVPASIEGKAPARLARDEFVVPADVVSGIGNGSSKAGHEQLYDMIARVRAARTGRTQQAPAINPKKVMPR